MLAASLAIALLQTAGAASPPPPCPPISGVERLLGPTAPSFVIFGETHGTSEAPELFGDIVCHAAAADPLVIALELPEEEQAPLSAFIASDGSPSERRALLRLAHWNSVDGRSSMAMLELLERLRKLREDGADLHVVAISGIPNPEGLDRDRIMADGWLRRGAPRSAPRLFALVGNCHAQRVATANCVQRQPAASLLPSQLVTTLLITGHEGRAWMCLRDGCGPASAGWGNEPRALIWVRSPDGAYDGEASTGRPYTASPPAQREPVG